MPPVAKYTKTKKKDNKQAGYTPKSADSAAKRNCKSVGGTWKNGKCVGGVI